MKKLFSFFISMSLIMSVFVIPVHANSYSENYADFTKNHQDGSIYTPDVYSKTKSLNNLFVEEFYSDVFFPISLNQLKAINEISTSATDKIFVSFFDELYAGDIIRMDNDTFSIYLSHSSSNVQLYDVGNPMSGKGDATISQRTYSFSDFQRYAKVLYSYQPNKQDYKILSTKTNKARYVDWGMPNVSKNALKIAVGSELNITVRDYYEDGKSEESVGDYVYSISDASIATIVKDKTLVAKKTGIAYLTATSKSGNYAPPEMLKIQVVAESVATPYQSYWGMDTDDDVLYAQSGEEIELSALQKKGTTLLDITDSLDYKISDTNIAYIKGKKIIPLRSGETVLSAYSYSADIAAPRSLIIRVDYDENNQYVDSDTPIWTISSLSGKNLSLDLDQEVTFRLYIIRNNKEMDVTNEYTFTTRNPSIASVHGYKITGNSSGTTSLIATSTTGSLKDPHTITVTVSKEYDDGTKKDGTTDAETREIREDSYYTFWDNINLKDNELDLQVGQSVNLEVYLQYGYKLRQVTDQVSISSTNSEVAYIHNSNVLTAKSTGTTTIKGISRGKFAPDPPEITLTVRANTTYNKNNMPIWTIASMDSDRLRINLSNYTAKYISVGMINSAGLNDTTSLFEFDTEDHDIATVNKDGSLVPVSVGQTYLTASSKYKSDFAPEPLLVEVYEDTGEDGDIYFAIDGQTTENLRLSPEESVPFEIYIINRDGTKEECTREMIENITIKNTNVVLKEDKIYGKTIGSDTLSLNVPNLNLTVHDLNVEVRTLNKSIFENKGSFIDVTPSFWAKDYIKSLGQLNIINGFEDGSFRPNDFITTEQAVKLIMSAKDSKHAARHNINYDDSSYDFSEWARLSHNVSDWATAYIAEAYPIMIVSGAFADGIYGTTPITRIQVLALLTEASGLDGTGFDLAQKFVDFGTIPDWGYAPAEIMAENNIVIGDEFSQLNPNNYITRAEMSKLLYLTFFEQDLSNGHVDGSSAPSVMKY